MKKGIIVLSVLLLTLVVGQVVWGADVLRERLNDVDSLFDDYLHNPENHKALADARVILDSLLITYPNNYEVLWKSAKCYSDLGQYTDDRLTTWERGKEIAERATRLYPNRPEGYFWLAALIGQTGVEKGILNSLSMIKPMRDALERSIEIDPNYADSYNVLGALYMQAPGWPISIGNKKKSLEYASKAVELQPGNSSFHWGLYKSYSASGQKKEAREVLEWMVVMPVDPDYAAFAPFFKDLAEKELEKIKK